MTVMITGANGFSGRYLSSAISEDKVLVTREGETQCSKSNCSYHCDLLDFEKVSEMIRNIKPTRIYHLAGSFTNDYNTDHESNVLTTKNILDAVYKYSSSARVLLIGSAAEYGLVSKENCPVAESSSLRPFSIYGLTKINQKTIMDYYVNTKSLDIVMARPFNLYGKGISSRLFIGKVYQEINSLKNGDVDKISLGNLDSERDFISIENAVKHYIRIMEKGIVGEVYNVASGKSIKIKDILSRILEEEHLDFNVVNANSRSEQTNDSDIIYADITKLKGLYNE